MLLVVLAMVVALLVWLAGDAFVAAVRAPALRPYLWLLPLGFFGAGMYQVLSYWAIRRRDFGRIARTKLSQGVGQVVAQVGLGFAGAGAPGLLVGDVIGRVAGGGGLALPGLPRAPRTGRLTRATLVAVAGRYRRFPLFTTWSGLLNVGSLQLPSILFSAGFGAAAAGLYALSFKMLVLPTMLVGQAVGQVFLSRGHRGRAGPGTAAPPHRAHRARAVRLRAAGLRRGRARRTPALRDGDGQRSGRQAGRYAQVLAPWFVVWLVSSPLSGLLSVREWQGSALGFSRIRVRAPARAPWSSGRAEGSPVLAVALLSASGVVISVASIVRFMHAGHSSVGRMLDPAGRLLALAGRVPPPGRHRAPRRERARWRSSPARWRSPRTTSSCSVPSLASRISTARPRPSSASP